MYNILKFTVQELKVSNFLKFISLKFKDFYYLSALKYSTEKTVFTEKKLTNRYKEKPKIIYHSLTYQSIVIQHLNKFLE